MSANTKIEWCDHTFNPWTGCTKISPGCDHCYAEGWARRSGQVQWGPGAQRRRTSAANWKLPLRWNAQAEAFYNEQGRRQRVFCASLADVFDNAVDSEWRQDLANLILSTPSLDWLLLTKRIGNTGRMLGEMFLDGTPDNVWIGATITNQDEADRDIPKLLATPARIRFLSMEPLLGPVDIDSTARVPCPNAENSVMDSETGCYECCRACDYTGVSDDWGIDWVIVGGESGPGARPMHPEWARGLRDQCVEAGVPFLFKQWGDWKPISHMVEAEHQALYRSNRRAREGQDQSVLDDVHGRTCTVQNLCLRSNGEHATACTPNAWNAEASPVLGFRVGKSAAGRYLDGRTHDGFPSALPGKEN